LSEDEVKPMIALEALAMNKLIYASKIAAHEELEKEFSNFYVYDNPLEEIFKINKKIIDIQKIKKSEEELKKYSWQEFIKNVQRKIIGKYAE
jgi:hypothetical protein